MSEGVEPNAMDILGSINTVTGRQLALQLLFMGLLESLRHKELLADSEIQIIIDAASAGLSESSENNARANPGAAEYISEIRTGAEKVLASIRSEIAKSSD